MNIVEYCGRLVGNISLHIPSCSFYQIISSFYNYRLKFGDSDSLPGCSTMPVFLFKESPCLWFSNPYLLVYLTANFIKYAIWYSMIWPHWKMVRKIHVIDHIDRDLRHDLMIDMVIQMDFTMIYHITYHIFMFSHIYSWLTIHIYRYPWYSCFFVQWFYHIY